MAEVSHGNSDRPKQQTCLAVSAAVKEIVQTVLSKSSKAGIQVSIKSTKSLHRCPSNSWFYIKVTSKSRIERIQLEGKDKNPALYTILEYMQSLENESHFCIQNPCDLENEGHGSSQQNLIIEGERLNVLNEVRRSKQIEESILHLRICDSKLHMMEECSHVHSYMCQVRIFRPKVDMRFTMKIGEAVSRTDFRVESRRKVSQYLPSVVTDPAFFLQDSDMTAVSDTVVPCTIDPVLTSVQILTAQNVYSNRSLQISTVGLYIPVEQRVTTSICTLTFYGPGYLPLDVNVPSYLLAEVDWSRYRLKVNNEHISTTYKGVLSHHASVGLKPSGRGSDIGSFIIQVFILLQFDNTDGTIVDYEEINQNMELLFRDHGCTMISVIQEITNKLLQPLINHAKVGLNMTGTGRCFLEQEKDGLESFENLFHNQTKINMFKLNQSLLNRDVVMRSISGICKAVTDIVSMSSNEQFRASSLQYMKVKDTVELGEELSHKLTDISQRKHAGVWTHYHRKYAQSFQAHFGHEVFCCGSNDSQEGFNAAGRGTDAVVSNTREDIAGQCNRNIEKHQDGYHGNRNNDLNKHSDVLSDRAYLNPYSIDSNKNQNNTSVSIPRCKEYEENCVGTTERRVLNLEKNPEVQNIRKDIEKMSPFHQLIETSPCTGMDISPDLLKITQGMKDVSPFQQLNEVNEVHATLEVSIEDPCVLDPQTVSKGQSTVSNMTPDVAQVIQGMEDVSPFQQLACDDQIVPASPNINTEDPCVPQQEGHDKGITEYLVKSHVTLPSNLTNSAYSVHEFSLKQDTSNNSLHKEELAKRVSDHTKLPSASNQRTQNSFTDKNASSWYETYLPKDESDFELLNSEDFGPTLETVSDFIGEMKCVDNSKMIRELLEDSKYDKVVNDNKSINFTEKLSQHEKAVSFSVTDTVSIGGKSIDDFDIKSPEESNKPADSGKQDLDDWFNDVLLEVGEWFD